jgi:hypothetical protein
MSYVMPWNFSVMALEGFYLQTNYCFQDLAGVEKKACIITKITEYILSQNADRWRNAEPFLSTGELKAAWAAFFGAQLQSIVLKGKGKQQKGFDPRLALGICFTWNNGQCLKPAGSCTKAKGRALKHVCDFMPDPSKPGEVCGKEHMQKDFHK